jgi:hypothetical protein
MNKAIGEQVQAGVRMRHRQQQSMPFGLVFVVLTTLGAVAGVLTGLNANSIRTSSVLPVEEPEPFERTQSIPAYSVAESSLTTSSIPESSIPASAPAPAPQETAVAAANNEWPDEPALLFSPVPAYPVAVAYASAAAPEPAAFAAPNAAPPAAAAKPSAQAVAARRAAIRPGNVLNDAQIASIKKRLNLTPDQESLWPAVETALRNISYAHKGKEIKVASAGTGPMAYVDAQSAEVQQLKYAAIPLIMRLNDDQKREVKSMAYVMGLESMASGF